MCKALIKMKIPYKDKGKHSERTVEVPCKKCAECAQMRIRHWTGRILAECQSGATPWFVTLTYEGGYDNEKAYWLDYEDVQKFFKKVRIAGFKFRYIIVGEYGTEADRAHWHLLILWEGAEPVGQFNTQEYTWPYWKHGFTYIERPRNIQATASYILKYLLKDPNAKIRYSRRPALGEDYLMSYARKHAVEGLSLFPKQATFTVPGNQNEKGKLFYYYIDRQSSIYERMMDHYLECWAEIRPNEKLPLNPNMIEHIEDILQGPVTPSAALQEYLEAVYDAQTPPLQANDFTVHTLYNGFIAVCTKQGILLEKRREDKVLWRKALENPTGDHRVLDPSLRRLLIKELRAAPQFCRDQSALEKQFSLANL
ncbi:replication initiator protein [Microviridae sp.]|nr:replication initiator protein [Microviridae sp.]